MRVGEAGEREREVDVRVLVYRALPDVVDVVVRDDIFRCGEFFERLPEPSYLVGPAEGRHAADRREIRLTADFWRERMPQPLVRVRVDETRRDVLALGVDHRAAVGQRIVRPDGGDLPALDRDATGKNPLGRDNLPAPYDGIDGHAF